LFGGASAESSLVAKKEEKGGEEAPLVPSDSSKYGATHERTISQDIEISDDLPYVTEKKNLSSEPASNWAAVSLYLPDESEVVENKDDDEDDVEKVEEMAKAASAGLGGTLRASMAYTRSSVLKDLFQNTEPPSKSHDLYELKYNEFTNNLECFLWQRSYFYTKAYFGNHAWHLRWFNFTADVVSSVPDRQNAEEHKMVYCKFDKIIIDENRLIIKLVHSSENRRNYTFMAPAKSIFDKVVHQLQVHMELHSGDEDVEEFNDHGDADHHVDLIEFPSKGSKLEMFFWLLLSPLRFAMHFTVPDVRQLNEHGDVKTSVRMAFTSTFMCLVWLIVGSYAMVASLERLADLMDIPDAVVGVTVSAAGTSLPNYVASKVAAQNGFGNQAVSNAFGSNTFNIMVGLGLPWLLYTSFGTGFEPYHGLRNEGILQSIIILAVVLLIFVLLMLQTGFVIRKWHGTLFICMYVAYLSLAIGQVYLS